MGNGRKLTTSGSERLLGSFGDNHGGRTAHGASELGEDEVWSMIDGTVNGDDYSENGERGPRSTRESNGSFSSYRNRHPPQRNDRRQHRQVGGLSLAFHDSSNNSSPKIVHQFRAQDGVAQSPHGRNMATSAPVNVPDWSKIYRVNSVESLHNADYDDDSEIVPPHEYLAREYARSRMIAANSVFEGLGRTLKGRDLSRVRDAVWSQTGFDG